MPVDEDRDGTPEDGSVLIWANDINFKSSSPCGLDLTFSFDAEGLESSLEFTCANVGVNDLSVYVTDTNGNQSFCRVGIFVQNNAANIPGCNANDIAEDAEDEQAEAEEAEEEDQAAEEGEANDDAGEEVDGDADVPDEEVYVEHDSEDVDGEADQAGEDEAVEENEAASEDGADSGESESDTTGQADQDTSNLSMIYGNLMSMNGEALQASIMFEGESFDLAGQVEFETVLVTTIIDSFINDFGETLYITDFNYEERPIEGSGTSTFAKEALVNDLGEYSATEIPMGQTVSINPTVNAAEYVANLTTADGIILFEHLTGINRITDPHTLIAADIDGDLDIDFDDVELLIEYLAGDLAELPNQEWIFADASYQFENADAPWAEIFFTNEIFVDQQTYEMDFIGIQIGDLGDMDLESRTTIEDLRRQVDEYLGKTFSSDVSISPNPFTNEIQLTVKSNATESAVLRMFDLTGKLIAEKQVNLESGENTKTILLEDSSYTGTIIYRLNSPTHEYRGKLIRLK